MRHAIAGPSTAGPVFCSCKTGTSTVHGGRMLLSSLQGCHVFIFLDSVTCNSRSHNQRIY